MFSKQDSEKESFLESTKAAREERACEKKKEHSVIVVQSCIRGWLMRRRHRKEILESFDALLNNGETALKPTLEVYPVAKSFLSLLRRGIDNSLTDRFELLCRYLVRSLESESKSLSYVGLVMNKETALAWVAHIKNLLLLCCNMLQKLSPEFPLDMTSILVYLHTLYAFTGTKTWKLLDCSKSDALRSAMNIICRTIMEYLVAHGFYTTLKILLRKGLGRSKIVLKHAALSAIMRLAFIPLQIGQFSDETMLVFIIFILSVPGLVLHLQNVAPECVAVLTKNDICRKCIVNILHHQQNFKIIFNALEGSYALCLLANIVHLSYLERDTTLKEICFPCYAGSYALCLLANIAHLSYLERDTTLKEICFLYYADVITVLLGTCHEYVEIKQSNMTHWHPILGWFSQKIDPILQESVPHVKEQLYLLWRSPMVNILLAEPLADLVSCVTLPSPTQASANQGTGFGSVILRHVAERRLARSVHVPQFKFGSPEVTKIALLARMYHTALTTMPQLRLDILTGLCYHDKVLYNLWRFFGGLGNNYGLKAYLDMLALKSENKLTPPEFLIFNLFADCMIHYVTILDDVEMYEQQNNFKLDDYVAISNLLNQFLYKIISHYKLDVRFMWHYPLFQSVHNLLQVLYRRDCRRRFTPENHWLIKEIKMATFISEHQRGRKMCQMLLMKMPHVIPQSERVRMFKKHIANEKAVAGLTESACVSPNSTLITVHRTRIVEDGYRQLAALPAQALKGVVRVRFINEQGLDEAGIDQDGVFKEFLEETIKRVFDPSLNLFRVTSEQRLYPSPTSHMQDIHLQLFEFVGRMVGKAIYEGIVVDVPFASFFLSQLLGQPQQALYSSIDELPSLDAELYQSLTFIKHTQTDVQDLDLTFSVDEDCLGKLVTHELVPGGKAMPVTNENKIQYVHLMAHFRMHTQIKEQTTAFIRGFRSIINPEWLTLFSAPELQRLISGDNVPIDMKSLRKHTQYYGGFHDSHRVVVWLWEILEKDFSEEEKRLFLKFVTSCSKPPLLGFGQLEPPFSIRCVEVCDDEDPGDTVGSVIRGFFTIRKKDPQNRLPTSSTCFNLLKLPNYQKKNTLKEKLRYAVMSNTGFELS